MNFGNIFGLWALAIIPIIIGLHMFRRRYRAKKINALFLFGSDIHDQSSGRTRERLRMSKSLLAEIFAVLALTWFLSDPFWSSHQQAQHVILILDTHQRLQATDDSGPTIEHLRTQALALSDQLSDHDRMTIIASGRIPQLLTGSAVPVSEARLAIERWQAKQAYHSYHNTWRMAADLGKASAHAHIVFISDHRAQDIPKKWQQISSGQQLSNSGLIDARWLSDKRGQRIFVRLLRSSDTSARSLQLFNTDAGNTQNPENINNTLIAQQAIPQKDGFHNFVFPLPNSVTSQRISVRIRGTDALASDDSSSLQKNNPRMVTVYVDPQIPDADLIKRGLESTEEVILSDTLTTAQLCILADPTQHTIPASCWQVVFRPGTGNSVIGPFLTRSGHPLLQDIDCTGTLWSGTLNNTNTVDTGTTAIARNTQQHNLLLAGSQILISEQKILNRIQITMHIDLTSSSLLQHPAWPSLCANLIDWRQSFLPGLTHRNLILQQQNRLIIPSNADAVLITGPTGEKNTYYADADKSILIPGQYQDGLYTIDLQKNAQTYSRHWQRFEVTSLHTQTTDLSQCTSSNNSSRLSFTGPSGSVQRIRSRSEHMIPLLLALAAALSAWFLYTREQGVHR